MEDLCIIEKGGDFGGTWYWNRYPGAQCDVESYCYLPLLEELNYVPKEKYSYAREILSHSSAIGQHYNLYACALFQTEVTELRWDEELQRWIVQTNRGRCDKGALRLYGERSAAPAGNCPALKAFATSKGTLFIPAGGTMTIPAVARMAALTNLRTSGSRSSVRVRRPFSVCLSWVKRHSSFMSFNARRVQ